MVKLTLEVTQKTYDKMLNQAYKERRGVATILSQLVEREYFKVPEAEMSTIDLEINEEAMEFVEKECERLLMTKDEFIMKVLIEQLGVEDEQN